MRQPRYEPRAVDVAEVPALAIVASMRVDDLAQIPLAYPTYGGFDKQIIRFRVGVRSETPRIDSFSALRYRATQAACVILIREHWRRGQYPPVAELVAEHVSGLGRRLREAVYKGGDPMHVANQEMAEA